jgi:hypothetical protein
MDEPSIKGIILLRSWSQLHSLLDEGRVSREDLELRLEPRDLQIFDEKVEPSLWYPLDTLTRISNVVCDLTGREGPEEWIQRGHVVIEGVLENPNFAKFFEAARKKGVQAGPTLVGMAALLLNFGEMRFQGDFTRFAVTLTSARSVPDLIRYSIQGAIQSLAERIVDEPIEVTSERPDEDTIVYEGWRRASGNVSH